MFCYEITVIAYLRTGMLTPLHFTPLLPTYRTVQVLYCTSKSIKFGPTDSQPTHARDRPGRKSTFHARTHAKTARHPHRASATLGAHQILRIPSLQWLWNQAKSQPPLPMRRPSDDHHQSQSCSLQRVKLQTIGMARCSASWLSMRTTPSPGLRL